MSLLAPLHRRRLRAIAVELAAAQHASVAAAGLATALLDLLGCTRAYCLFHDAEAGVLWSEPPDEREIRAELGLVGAVLRGRAPLLVERADTHPSYSTAIDDPAGSGSEQLLVQPIVGNAAEVHAVLVAVRTSNEPIFSALEIELADALASYAAPMLEHLARVLEDATDAVTAEGLFRPESVQAREHGLGHGDVVRVTPHWITPVSWLVAAFVVALLGLLAFGSIDQYSTGVGVVRAGDRTHVVSREAGTLDAWLVEPGQAVAAGDVLARLDDVDLRADVARLDAELHAHLRNRMRAPDDPQFAQSVLALQAELESARARLRTRELRATHAGVVVDHRARVGQPVAPGDVLLTMSKAPEHYELIALLPGDDRPQIAPGMRLRFEIPGYRHEYQWLEVIEVDDTILGPTEAQRVLGPEHRDVLVPAGPSVLVRAELPDASFVSRGERLAYHDGMFGTAEIRLRRESLAVVLLPWTKELMP